MTFPLSPAPAWFYNADWSTTGRKRNGVHYVGEDVVVYLTPASGSVTGTRRNGFEYGTDEATITTSDYSGTDNRFNGVTGSPVYDTARAAVGSVSMRVPNSTSQWAEWTYGSQTEDYGRFYLYATAYPTSEVTVQSGQGHRIRITTAGKVKLTDSGAGGHSSTGSVSIALNQWVRIEYHHMFSTTAGTMEAKLFNTAESTTASETVTGGPSWNTGASNNLARFGSIQSSAWGSVIWMDGLVALDDEYPGPSSEEAPPESSWTVTVRDYYGTIVSTATIPVSASITLTAPTGGWDPGWYRLYVTGPDTDATFGDAVMATNFCVIREDDHFVAMPDPSVSGSTTVGSSHNGEYPDFVMKGVMGLGTSRHIITDATSLGNQVAVASADAALNLAYQHDTDPVRESFEQWCTFPNGGYTAGQQAGVTSAVTTLYAAGIRYFEGPQNEGTLNSTLASRMQSFQSAVHAGHASAKAIGPCAINISDLTPWRAFGDAGGFDYCDEIATHMYNFATNGDLNLGRSTLDAWVAMLAEYGADTKPRWQTEATGAFPSVYGVYHPRRARVQLLTTLLLEQYDIPHERNAWWYDVSHGFWDFPNWIENGDGSLNPQAVMGRVLAEETWGKAYASAVDFGTPGNNIYLGNVYTGTSGSVVAVMSTSYLNNGSVTLTVTGTDSVVIVDGFGNATTTSVDGHDRVTVTLTDVPSYVELPTGASATVHAVNGFEIDASQTSLQTTSTTRNIGGFTALLFGSSKDVIADGGFETSYGGRVGIAISGNNPPDTAHILWDTPQSFNRVVLWSGKAWQPEATLVDFDIETTQDGSTWTVVETVTKTTPSSFKFGTDSTNAGCSRETYWDEQWIFDLDIDSQTALGLRISVRATSYGGEPDEAADDAGGQGWGNQHFTLQEIGVYQDSLLTACFTYQGDDTITVTYGGTVQFTYSGTAAFTYEGADGFTYQGVPGFTYQGAPGFTYDGVAGFTYQGTPGFTYDGTPAFSYEGTAGFTYGGTTGFTYQGEC